MSNVFSRQKNKKIDRTYNFEKIMVSFPNLDHNFENIIGSFIEFSYHSKNIEISSFYKL